MQINNDISRRRFRAKYPRNASGTPQQAAVVVEKRTALCRRLAIVREVQAVYMPCVPALVAKYTQAQRAAEKPTDLVEEQPLYLPSAVDAELLDTCEPGLADVELRLRDAQLTDSLDKLRVRLHMKTRLLAFKNNNIRHQLANTRAHQKLAVNEAKKQEYVDKYRAAREAKLQLSGSGSWEEQWRVLRDEDVRCIQEVEYDPKTHQIVTEGRRRVSWIWMSAGREGGESADLPGMDDGECIFG